MADYNESPLVLLGWYTPAGEEPQLVVADDDGTYLYTPSTNSWETIWDEAASGFVQYLDNAVLCSVAGPGGYWDGAAWHDTASMPASGNIVLYQERFWAFGIQGSADQSRIYFSNITAIDPPTDIFDWDTGTDFFEVGDGDGQWITTIVSDPNMLLIFRNGSTWSFDYGVEPADGTLRALNPLLGADGRFAVAPYQGYYYVLANGHLYQFVTYQYYPLDRQRVLFGSSAVEGGAQITHAVSIYGNRVMVAFDGTMYVYNIDAQAWSTWESPFARTAYFTQIPPLGDDSNTIAYAITGAGEASKQKLYRAQATPPAANGETFTCRIRTKAYEFTLSDLYKRLSYWTAELTAMGTVYGRLYPQELVGGVTTFDQMDESDFDTLEEGTWDNPLSAAFVSEDSVSWSAPLPQNMTIRYRQSIRFLRMIFEIESTIDGVAADTPFRIRQATAYLYSHNKTMRGVA